MELRDIWLKLSNYIFVWLYVCYGTTSPRILDSCSERYIYTQIIIEYVVVVASIAGVYLIW